MGDLIYGKCVQTGLLGFAIGGGFSAWQAASTRLLAAAAGGAQAPPPPWRPVLVEAAAEGARTSKMLVAATAAAGAASLLQHGRYSPRFYALRGEPATAFAAIFAGMVCYTPPAVSAGELGGLSALGGGGGGGVGTTLSHRIGSAFLMAVAGSLVAGLLPR